MNREKMTARIYLALTIIIMVTIFFFSAQDKIESAEISGGALEFILRTLGWILPEAVRLWLIRRIRKLAHFGIYFLLGTFVTGWFTAEDLQMSYQNTGLRGWMLAVLYAVSDEIHQYFVPGRSCQLSDVLLDSCGAAIGVLLMILLWRHKAGRRETFVKTNNC